MSLCVISALGANLSITVSKQCFIEFDKTFESFCIKFHQKQLKHFKTFEIFIVTHFEVPQMT